MPLLQPHEPRIRYRPGVKAWCDSQAAEDALGGGWSRYPQPLRGKEEPVAMPLGDIELDIDTMVAMVSPERVIYPPLVPGEVVIDGPDKDNIVTIGQNAAGAPKRKGGWPKGRPRKRKAER